MIPDPLTFAQEALGCREFADYESAGQCEADGTPWREVPDADA